MEFQTNCENDVLIVYLIGQDPADQPIKQLR